MAKQDEERREHKRHGLDCPVAVFCRGGQELTRGKTVNISDGGAFVSIPIKPIPDISADVNVTFSVPRTTPNTYMLEEFASPASIIRHQPLVDESLAGLAIRFDRPLELGLEA